MPVSNDHLADTVQVWDGLSFSVMAASKAKKLEREGTHQIATNRQASELMSAAQFNEVREAKAKKAAKAKTKNRSMKADLKLPGVGDSDKQEYKTREMKAE